MSGVSSIKGFFGKFKAAMNGEKKHGTEQVGRIHHDKRPSKSMPSSRGRRTTKGAFGGTGTGRNLRGKPGVKLLKKTVKAGFKAQKRVVFSTKPVGTIGGHS